MIAIKKKWRENGKREEAFWSNPHSKGEIFSRSINDFFDKKIQSIIIIFAITKMINDEKNMFIINY